MTNDDKLPEIDAEDPLAPAKELVEKNKEAHTRNEVTLRGGPYDGLTASVKNGVDSLTLTDEAGNYPVEYVRIEEGVFLSKTFAKS